MYCTKCGREISDTSSVCAYCGTHVHHNTMNNYNNNNYNQTNAQPYINRDTTPLSVGDYLIMWLLMCIPLVNIVMLCIWAFSMDANINKKNFAKAYLIVTLISIVLTIVMWGSLIALFEFVFLGAI